MPPDAAAIRLPEGQGGVTRFIALGDTGTGSDAQMAVARAAQQVCLRDGCDFMVLLGDNFYPGGLPGAGRAKFDKLVVKPYGPLHLPIVPVLGNHDLRSDPIYQVRAGRRYPEWKMPNFRYSFQSGAARFFAADTNCGALEWLRLAPEAREDSPDWTFVLGHHSVHSTGPHGDSDWLSEHVWDWLIESKVDFMLGGHNHVLEHLVEPGERPDYLVIGSSGRADPSDDAAEGEETEQRTRSATEATSLFFSETPGFVWIEATPGAVRTVFYDEKARPLHAFTKTRAHSAAAPFTSRPAPRSRASRDS